ncbi:MAG: hypothetical protein IT347_02405 [Candidatus Eisenbacteria bacterium]|nr:hypothetical protein [Candidatus Eisenbacteria bacterium]
MRIRPLLLAALLAAAAAPRARAAVPLPELLLAGGRTFAVTGHPSDGGVSFSMAVMWPFAERLRFGVQAYADDIGSELVQLYDPNDGTPLGTAAESHRWAWGAAWRADADVWRRGPWAGGVSGAFGAWRVEDDRRGRTYAAGSSVGFRLGADVRRSLGRGRDLGVEINYHRLDQSKAAAWQHVGRYASAAIQFRWAGGGDNDR